MNKTIIGEYYYRGADKSLARLGRKQSTATELIFASHSKKKNSESCPNNQVSAAAMTSASHEKWRPFNCFFSRVALRTYQHSYTGLFISPSGISELDCVTTKTDTTERSISIGRESLQVFFCTRGLGVLPGSTVRG